MITDFSKLVQKCTEELESRQYNSLYLRHLQLGWDRLQNWMTDQGLTQYSKEIGIRFCNEVLGGHLSHEEMSREDHHTLRAVRMLFSYQENDNFELRAPRIERCLEGPIGNVAKLYLEANRNVISDPQISERETQALWKKYAALKRMDEKKSKARHPFRKLIDLVACLILVAGIGLTVAIARNDGFRNQISQMIIGMGQDASESYLNTDYTIHVPNEWKGHYYPAYIPQTLMLSQDESFLMNYVVYKKGAQLLDFGEYTSQDTVWLDTNGTEAEKMNLCHIPAVLYERKYSDGANCLTFVFQPDNCTLILSLQNMTKAEALKVADSVRMIQ